MQDKINEEATKKFEAIQPLYGLDGKIGIKSKGPETIITNGHFLICVPSLGDYPAFNWDVDALFKLHSNLYRPVTDELIAWTGTVEYEAKGTVRDCPMCHGEGSHGCSCGDEHDCGECHGNGTVGRKEIPQGAGPGKLYGSVINRSYLALAIDCLKIYGQVEISAPSGQNPPLHSKVPDDQVFYLRAGAARAAIMAMRSGGQDWDEYEFEGDEFQGEVNSHSANHDVGESGVSSLP
jgi:hypothetical protein